MSTMTLQIDPETYFTALAALREQHKVQPDRRYMGALNDLRVAMLREVDREIASVTEPPRVPAFLRKQAG